MDTDRVESLLVERFLVVVPPVICEDKHNAAYTAAAGC